MLKRGALEGSDTWHRLIFKPGQDPFENLGIGLANSLAGPAFWRRTELPRHRPIWPRSRPFAPHGREAALRDDPPAARLLVVADQFEEVFTLCKSEEDRRALIDNLSRLP